MITAIVLVKTRVDRVSEVAQTLAEIDGVSEVYSITGNYDLIAVVRVREHDQLSDVIPGRIGKVNGVEHSETHIAFRAYSRHDLDAIFDIGLD